MTGIIGNKSVRSRAVEEGHYIILCKKSESMIYSTIFIILTFCLVQFVVRDTASESICGVPGTGRILTISVNTKRNHSGEWVTKFSARRDSNITINDMNLDVAHEVVECDGKQTVHIQGVIKDMPAEEEVGKLTFHTNIGKNAIISNNGRSLEKIKLDDATNGVALTNRPIKNNELFEVRIDKKGTKFTHAIGIGVTALSPDVITIPSHMNSMCVGTWMMYINNVYNNGSAIKTNFMRDLKELKVGDRIGVMRKDSGSLHLYINGVDQGEAANKLPYPVYGVFELYHDVSKVTII